MTEFPNTPPHTPPAFHRLSPDELAARKRRNLWIALALVAFMVLLFTTTFLRMIHNQQAAREQGAAVASAAPARVAGSPAGRAS